MSEWFVLIIGTALLLFYTVLLVYTLQLRGSREIRSLRGLRWHIDPFILIVQYRSINERIEPAVQRQRMLLAILNGGECSKERLWTWIAESIGQSYLVISISTLLALMADDSTLFLVGVAVGSCLPVQRVKQLNQQVNQRKQAIVMELPELLSRLLLMVNAGDQVLHAIARCVEKGDREHPLYLEFSRAIEGLKRGESLSYALEEMGRRCAVPEVRLFATTVLINARRGGEAFVPSLRELTRQMWERRKAMARMLGEQASSKLAFPLAIIFLLIMVLVGAPTMLMM